MKAKGFAAVALLAGMHVGCTVVDVTTTDASGRKKTAWGLQTPFGEVGARATDGSDRRMKVVVDNPPPGTYVQTGANWQPRDPQPQMDSGQRYVATGASWQPRPAQYQQDSGQRYNPTGAAWRPNDAKYQQDSGQRYQNAPPHIPAAPNYERDNGQRYVGPGAAVRPNEPQYEKDSGQRYVNAPPHVPRDPVPANSTSPRYVNTPQTAGSGQASPRKYYVYQTFPPGSPSPATAARGPAPMTPDQWESYKKLGAFGYQAVKEGYYIVTDNPRKVLKGYPKLYEATQDVAQRMSDPTRWGLTIPGPVRENPMTRE